MNGPSAEPHARTRLDPRKAALLVVDVQRGFDDPSWGPRDNPDCDANVSTLIAAWRRAGAATVFVRHDSTQPGSPLVPGSSGNALKDILAGEPDLLVTKSVNCAFFGEPDLERWLRGRGIDTVAVCGITTDHCCDTTARVAANLGFDVLFAIDATHTFDRPAVDGATIPAAVVSRVTAASLDGEFARVVRTADLIAALAPPPA